MNLIFNFSECAYIRPLKLMMDAFKVRPVFMEDKGGLAPTEFGIAPHKFDFFDVFSNFPK